MLERSDIERMLTRGGAYNGLPSSGKFRMTKINGMDINKDVVNEATAITANMLANHEDKYGPKIRAGKAYLSRSFTQRAIDTYGDIRLLSKAENYLEMYGVR